MTAMPAWGRSMADDDVWNLVAFLRRLPQMSEEQYRAEVAASGGHHHASSEDHAHDEGAAAHEHGEAGHSMQEAHEHRTPPQESEDGHKH